MPRLDRSRAAAAWILVDSSAPDSFPCSGCTPVCGAPSAINAYRAELQGLHTILLAVHVLCTYHQISSGSLRVFCDNLRAVNLASTPTESLRAQLSHLDLLRAITSLRASLPIDIVISHVTGHQDTSSILWESLPLEAQLNVRCDHWAKKFLLDCTRRQLPPPPTSIYSEGLFVCLNGQKVSHGLHEAVQAHAGEFDFRAYLLSKHYLSADSYAWVNWEATETAFSTMSTPFRLWAVKFISGFSGTAVQRHRWGQWASPLCPCCSQHPETTTHLLTCHAPTILQARQMGLSKLCTWLLAWDTHPMLYDLIQALCTETPTYPSTMLSHPELNLPLAFARQLSLGNANFWFGRHVRLFEDIQSDYYLSISSPRSGRAWAAGLISHILTVGHDIWVARNDVVHSTSLRGLDIMESAQMAVEIRDQFRLGSSSLLAADRHWIEARPIDQILALPADQKRIWLSSVHLARDIGLEARNSDLHQMSSLMHRWLGN